MHDGGLRAGARSLATLPSAFILRPSPHKVRSGVARPAAISGVEDKLHAAQVSARASQIAARELLFGLAVDEDADNLARATLRTISP